MRADIFVTKAFPGYSRSSLASLFETGKVTINGKPIKAGQKLKPQDEIQIDAADLFKQPEKIELPVIYEDRDVIVINKPAGVLTHSKGAINHEATVASFIRSKITDEGLSGNRAGIIHRLDRMTSGIIITAKNQPAMTWLQRQFSSRKLKKVYVAIIEGVPKETQAIIDAPIGRNPKKPQTFKVLSSGRQAQTKYKVLKSFKKGPKAYSLLELEPITGRTHQIRVHLAYIGNPVYGDPMYGDAGDQLMLHAKSLEIILPDKTKHTFKAPAPKYFKDFLRA